MENNLHRNDSRPLLNKTIHLIGRFRHTKTQLREKIEDLGGKNWRKGCKQPPTNLILAPATTVKKELSIQNEVSKFVGRFGNISAEVIDVDWLLDKHRDWQNSEKPNESLRSTGQTESYISIPSRQIAPVTPPPADRTTDRAREGQENLLSMRTDLAVSKIVPDTLPSNIQDKVTTAIVEPICTRQAGEVSVRFEPDVNHDDEEGNYIVVINAELTSKFEVLGFLGEGGYGKVVKARRVPESEDVAIKISALGKECSDAARKELRILETLKMHDEKNQKGYIRVQECFEYRGHICMVMDLLGQSTYDFLEQNKFVPFPNSQIQSFAKQLFRSVACLVHADIKPENLLLCKDAYRTLSYERERPSSFHVRSKEARYAAERHVLKNTEIRLIDFGLATFIDESPSYFHSTRVYSAPETWLYHQATFSHDIWSIGCILVEFFTGDPLFNTDDMTEYLAMTEAVTGLKLEDEISWITDAKFRDTLSALIPNAMQEPRKKIQRMKMKHLDQIILGNDDFLRNFADLLKRIFVLNPDHRITAKQALGHPCLTEIAEPDDGTLAAEPNSASTPATP
ncbi:kinase-like domain-containing protein [Fusarium oxysporum f. sp. albedinis]|nr:kinase-like domain-containing protein [Fusarium oxysporum f. sp. albedinis]